MTSVSIATKSTGNESTLLIRLEAMMKEWPPVQLYILHNLHSLHQKELKLNL